ncbi:MAG TPA: S8 family serine peptidase, partial [Vicinamibacterales bacterium]|nr:S8 family serine peptidase [Vicinamibacterales bacterium]
MNGARRKAVWGPARVLGIALVCVGLAAPGAKAGDHPQRKLDAHLQHALATGSGQQRVIVRVKPGSRGALVRSLRTQGHSVYAEHAGIDAFSVQVPAAALRALVDDSRVDSISVDGHINGLDKATSISTSTYTSASTLLTTLALGDFGMGSTIGVAVLDSGLQDDGNFTGRIMEFHDFTSATPAANTTPYDDYGHGTHVAGLIGSSGVLSSGKYEGVAQSVRLLILKVLDQTGSGQTS